MKKNLDLQNKMYLDIQDKALFTKALDFGLRYLEEVFDRNVFPTKDAVERLNDLVEDMPQFPSSAASILDLLAEYGSPATVTYLGGRYFGFVNGSAVPAGLAAKILATFWDQNAAMQVLSPTVSKLESIVENWMKELFNLPEGTVAGFVSGTSLATFCGLAAARYRLLQRMGWDINEKGLFGAPSIRVVTGKHAHSTVMKAVSLLGFGKESIEWVEVDDQGRMIPGLLPQLDDRTILILQAGNVNSGSFDAFDEICEQANRANTWVHIDGAFGLWAAVTEELSYLTKGIENASSWSVDGHKTLNTPYDCGIVLCSDADAIVSALHMSGSYIILSDSKDGMLYTPEMSRRARVIELWATLKYLGKSGIDEMVMGFHERAKQISQELNAYGFEIMNEVVYNQVLVTCGSDALTDQTIKNIQESGECWVGGAKWFGKSVVRISICSWATTEEDISRSVRAFVAAREKAKEMLSRSSV